MTDYRIWPATNGPNTSGSDGQPINLGTEFYVTSTAWATRIRWYRGTTSVNPDNLRLYRVDSASSGTLLREVVSPSASGTGWQESVISPLSLTLNQRYKVVAHFPDHYTATPGYWTTGGPGQGGLTNGLLVAPDTSQAIGGGQGTFEYNASPVFPTGSFNGGSYWVDVVVTDVDPSEVRVILAQAVEIDTAQPLTVVKRRVLEQAVEIDTALPIVARTVQPVPGVHSASSAVGNLSVASTVSGLEAT